MIKNLTIASFCEYKKMHQEDQQKKKLEEKKLLEEKENFYVNRIKAMSIKILKKKPKNKGKNKLETLKQSNFNLDTKKNKNSSHINNPNSKTSIWNFIREILNNPYIVINDDISDWNFNFYNTLNRYMNKERQNLIENIIFYYTPRSSSPSESTSQKKTESYENQTDSLSQIFHFIKILNSIFLVYIEKNSKVKEKLYFYYWILIHFMNYDIDDKKFDHSFVLRI